jgi:hypothetical protein
MVPASILGALFTLALLPLLSSVFPALAMAQDSSDPPATTPEERSLEQAEDNLWRIHPNFGYGPFHSTALGFFTSLRPGSAPRTGGVHPDGSFEARATESWAKVIAAREGTFNLDYEVLRTEASISYEVCEGTLLELNFDTAARVHGILDPLMNGFHDTFGIPLGPRGRLPNNSFKIELQPGQGRPDINLDHDAGRPFTRVAILSVEQTLTEGDEGIPAVFASLSLEPSLGHLELLRGGGPIDLSASLSFAKGLGDFYVYLACNISWYGTESFAGTRLQPYQWGVLGAVEWRCLEDVSIVIQSLTMRGAVGDFSNFSKPSNELCFGFKWQFDQNFVLSFAMIHDVEDPVNTPDFGFQIELAIRW